MYEKLEPVDVFRSNYHHFLLMEYLSYRLIASAMQEHEKQIFMNSLQVSSVVLLIVLIQEVLLLLQYVSSI